ncbi:MAG: SDR family NAD(P)-dependent oxidoreductase [Clostridia bacterium]|jgi:NAD(P)-dependent dehydrogenase (short-subunit alcohol dehydrogenase family)|nr:SDR family oxidoreductase [Clostridia bacterium]MDH7574030.1 SDR family NAD(P)-dependent oxidoreductase [Clostridia bacterium]
MLLENRVAIVTGAARGIGKAIARRFAEEGGAVALVDLQDQEAQAAAAELAGRGHRALAMRCDVSDSRQVKEMVGTVLREFGQIDILVNNAAFGPPSRRFAEIPEEEWDKTIAVNLKGVFLTCQAVLPHMQERGYGKIINISSGNAVAPALPMAHYAASKAGVLGLTNDIALEYAPYGICINAILPGPVRTELWDCNIPPGVDKDDFFRELGQVVPMKRVGMPEDIASVALFLASDLSSFVTAGQIHVGGGLPLRYQVEP